jgi:hypothetical protein
MAPRPHSSSLAVSASYADDRPPGHPPHVTPSSYSAPSAFALLTRTPPSPRRTPCCSPSRSCPSLSRLSPPRLRSSNVTPGLSCPVFVLQVEEGGSSAKRWTPLPRKPRRGAKSGPEAGRRLGDLIGPPARDHHVETTTRTLLIRWWAASVLISPGRHAAFLFRPVHNSSVWLSTAACPPDALRCSSGWASRSSTLKTVIFALSTTREPPSLRRRPSQRHELSLLMRRPDRTAFEPLMPWFLCRFPRAVGVAAPSPPAGGTSGKGSSPRYCSAEVLHPLRVKEARATAFQRGVARTPRPAKRASS